MTSKNQGGYGGLKPMVLAIVALFGGAFCQSALAEEDVTGAGDVVLSEVISTATRTEMALEFAPGNASVVTRADIDKTPRASVKELVRSQEGVVTGQFRGQSDLAPEITLRGVPNQARTMILIDGIPVQTSYSGQAQAIGGLNVDDVQQVEIVRGPFSSLYGSSAMGGVVNFVTAMPKGREYRASLGYGDAFEEGRAQKQMVRGYVSGAENFGDLLKVKVSYGWMDSKGYRSDFATSALSPAGGVTGADLQSTTTGGSQYIIGNKGRGALDKYDFSAKAELKASSADVLSVSYMQSNLHNQYEDPESYLRSAAGATVYSSVTSNPARPIRESAFINASSDTSNDILSLDWKHRFADSRLSVKLARLTVDEWYTTAGTGATTTLAGGPGTLTPRESENNYLDVLWEKPLGDSILLLGGQYKTTRSLADTYSLSDWNNENSKGAKTTSSGGKERVFALFGDWQVPLSDKLSATVGGRFERWTGYDGYTVDYTQPLNTTLNQSYGSQTQNNFSPKLTTAYQLFEQTRLKASWGKAFRAPDALNLYRNYGTTTVYVSNPALKPETSVSYDVGVEQSTPRNGLLKAYLFATSIEDMISTRDLNSAGSIKKRINVGKARSRGLELALAQPLPYNLKLTANYTLLQTKVLENDYEPTSVGKQLPYVPRWMANLGIAYDDTVLFAVLNYQYMAKRYFNSSNNDTETGVPGAYDPYSLVNAKLGYRMTKNLDVSLAISNLLDKKFYNSVITEGRAWFVQAKVKF
jgi:iron complex outermembrane recepter protein